ncbi:MAG: hypothetical protein ACLFVP_06695 [Candidatus Bathyarchaeia archaeon]
MFTACFPDYYDDYLSEFMRIEPDLVVPFHYDAKEDVSHARGLVDLLKNAGLNATTMDVGESIDVQETSAFR